MVRRIAAVFCFALLALLGTAYAGEGVFAAGEAPDNGIPVVYLTIDESRGTIEDMNSSVDHSVYCYGKVRIDVPEGFRYSDLKEALTESTGELDMSIRGRGNSTWRATKKPYKIKLDKKKALLGEERGASKHWALLANAKDPTLIKDRITGWLGDEMGFEYSPRGVPVDMVMTGQKFGTRYLGSYYLTEDVRVDKTRLNIEELKASDVKTPTITGGYLLQNAFQVEQDSADRFYTSRGVDWATKTPSFDTSGGDSLSVYQQDTPPADRAEDDPPGADRKLAGASDLQDDPYDNPAQQQYIQDHIQKIEDALFGEDYKNADGTHYHDLMDMESTARYWLVNEFTLNGDAYMTSSTYIYKKRDSADGTVSKLQWGPLWDFDYAWGHASGKAEGFDSCGKWMKAVMYDKDFRDEVNRQWPQMKESLRELARDGGVIDQYAAETLLSAEQDRRIHQVASDHETYQEDIQQLKGWINARIKWVDAHLTDLKDASHRVRYMEGDRLLWIDYYDDGEPACAEDAEKEGYVFLGWFDSKGRKIGYDDKVTEDMTLTAKYVSEEEATHGRDIAFKKATDVTRYNPNARRYQIDYTVLPENAQYRAVEWSVKESSPEGFATVDEEGVITFNGTGQVTVTGNLKYGGSRDFTLTIVEQDKDLPFPASISPVRSELLIAAGEQDHIELITDPSPARISSYSYRSDDETIAKAGNSGVVTAVGPGTTLIHVTARAYDYNQKKQFDLTADVTVKVTGSGLLCTSPTKIRSARALKKGFKVSWKKVSGVRGYQVRWSTKPGMKAAKTKLIRSAKKTSFSKKKLKAGKKYYVQVRAYKTVDGKKYWSKWTAKRTIKTKK